MRQGGERVTTVCLSYVREKTGHALIGARQWIPREHIADPVKSLVMGLPLDLVFRTKGQLAIDLCAEAAADGIWVDFVCGDEVYGSCTELRSFLETCGQGYMLRIPSNFHLNLARGVKLTCKEAVSRRDGLNSRPAALGDEPAGYEACRRLVAGAGAALGAG